MFHTFVVSACHSFFLIGLPSFPYIHTVPKYLYHSTSLYFSLSPQPPIVFRNNKAASMCKNCYLIIVSILHIIPV